MVLRELIAIAMVAGACGPDVVASGGSSSATGSTTASMTTGTSSDGSGSAPADTSTGEPVPACDPAFASELAAGEVVWTFEAPAVFDGGYGTAVAVAANGRVFAAGSLDVDNTVDDVDGWVHALGVDGTPSWEARFGGAAGFGDWFTDLASTPTGDIVIVGIETLENGGVAASSEQVAMALAYDAAGRERWRRIIEPTDGAAITDAPPALALDADRILVGVTSMNDVGQQQISFAELDHGGEMRRRWDHADRILASMQLVDVDFDAQGAALALAGGPFSDGLWLGQLDPALSEVIGFVMHTDDGVVASALEPLADGALVLARVDTTRSTRRPLLLRYDSTGTVTWSHVLAWDGEESVAPNDMTIDCAGRIVVLATPADSQAWIVRLDADGNEIDRFADAVGGTGFRRDVASDPAGNVVVTGRGIEWMTGESFVVRMLAAGSLE